MEHNPYAAPTADLIGKTPEMGDLERIRNEYLKTETNVRSIGALFILGGVILTISSTISLVAAVTNTDENISYNLGVITFMLLLGVAELIIGFGLTRFRSEARIPGAVLSGLSMIKIPIGTLIGGYFLYTLAGEKGKYVFTQEYQEIRKATPHIKFKTSLASKILLVLLILIVVGLVAVAFNSR